MNCRVYIPNTLDIYIQHAAHISPIYWIYISNNLYERHFQKFSVEFIAISSKLSRFSFFFLIYILSLQCSLSKSTAGEPTVSMWQAFLCLSHFFSYLYHMIYDFMRFRQLRNLQFIQHFI